MLQLYTLSVKNKSVCLLNVSKNCLSDERKRIDYKLISNVGCITECDKLANLFMIQKQIYWLLIMPVRYNIYTPRINASHHSAFTINVSCKFKLLHL